MTAILHALKSLLPHVNSHPFWMIFTIMIVGLALCDTGQCRPPRATGEAIICIDVGHSKTDPGAISARGVVEYEFNRAFASSLAEALSQETEARVVFLDPREQGLSLAQRVRAAHRIGASLLISIHHDSVQPQFLKKAPYDGRVYAYSSYARGYSIFVSRKSPAYDESLKLAQGIGQQLRQAQYSPSTHHSDSIPGESRTLLDTYRGVYAHDGLYILRKSAMPTVLLEVGVLVHPQEEQDLANGEQQMRMATQVASGIRAYLSF